MSIRERFSRNERNRRTLLRGRAPRYERVTAEVKSRTPIYRDRINPATGRLHRDDPMMHRVRDEGLGKRKRDGDRERVAGQAVREYRERQDREARNEEAYRAYQDRERQAPARQQRPGRAAR